MKENFHHFADKNLKFKEKIKYEMTIFLGNANAITFMELCKRMLSEIIFIKGMDNFFSSNYRIVLLFFILKSNLFENNQINLFHKKTIRKTTA